ncbi:prepilin-type N-terminal cleavage/methylation domain-containing protein [Phytopseudomonas daroniae]|uniref:prepilin-type N-terminal cleavage/methylation domain-containing protein n=1 Tax=Phytopseudomonas daroniae TaxID=2487519 RepID=UPI00103851EC|nr:prepilin-type N-terminal cleavage/methylation domain-containing protein [Pseudomonas daroniae]TBU74085.1 general secretion pathway protein GspJ [Pseudomonas daroniae]
MKDSYSRGFTLLETLVALSLLALMFVLIATSLSSGNRVWDIVLRQSDHLAELRAARGFLSHALQQVRAVEMDGGVVFEGQSARIRFVAPGPRYLDGGLKAHTIWVDTPSRGSLSLRISFNNISDGQPWGESQVLFENAKSIRFGFMGDDIHGSPTSWLSEWPWPARLPRKVRIEIDTDSSISWMPMVVALRFQSDDVYK